VQRISYLLFFLFFVSPNEGNTAENKNEVESVLELLMAYDIEPQKVDFDEVSSDAKSILMKVASDTGRPPVVRARAILALGYYPSSETKNFLKATVFTQGQNEMLIRKGIYALARGFGSSVCEDIGSFLFHSNPDIRETAVRALGILGSNKARKMLIRRLKEENNKMVKNAIQEVLKKFKNQSVKKH